MREFCASKQGQKLLNSLNQCHESMKLLWLPSLVQRGAGITRPSGGRQKQKKKKKKHSWGTDTDTIPLSLSKSQGVSYVSCGSRGRECSFLEK